MQSDNGIEFDMKSFFQNEGICIKLVVLRPISRMVLPRGSINTLCMSLVQSFFSPNLACRFWSYVVTYAVFLINYVPTPFLKNTSPFERLYNKIFDINLIRVFWCLHFLSTKTADRKKNRCSC